MDYVQAIITRLANNSFLMKGWALTLSSALLGVAITQKQEGLAFAALVPVTAFWVLDTYYLRQERAFRNMYADIASKRLRDFKIDPKPYSESQSWTVGFSVSLRTFYLAIIVLTLVVAIILVVSAPAGSDDHSQPELRRNQNTSNRQSPTSSAVQSSQLPSPRHSVVPTTAPEPSTPETQTSTQP